MGNNAKVWTDEFSTIVERYAEQIMDGMDMKTMEQFVFDTLVDNLNSYTPEELETEVLESYGEEFIEDLLS